MNKVINLKVLENLRTKEEVAEYFKKQGIEITEEEIENLKQQYSSEKLNKSALTMQQLDKVAGGLLMIIKEMTDHVQFVQDCNDLMKSVTYAFTFSKIVGGEQKNYTCVLVDDGKKETRVTDVGNRKLEIENGNSLVFQNEYSESFQQEYIIQIQGGNTSVFNDIIWHSLEKRELTDEEKTAPPVCNIAAELMTNPGEIISIVNPLNKESKISFAYREGKIYSVTERILIHDGKNLNVRASSYYKNIFDAYEQSLGGSAEHYSRDFKGLRVLEESLGFVKPEHPSPTVPSQSSSQVVPTISVVEQSPQNVDLKQERPGEQTHQAADVYSERSPFIHDTDDESCCACWKYDSDCRKIVSFTALALAITAGLTTGAYFLINYLTNKYKP